MELSLHILAGLGFAAALWRSLRSAVHALRCGVESYYVREVARTRARRGDLTGVEEAAVEAAHAQREWRRAAGRLALWIALLALPAWLLESPVPIYATYVVLWFLPRLPGGSSGEPAGNRS